MNTASDVIFRVAFWVESLLQLWKFGWVYMHSCHTGEFCVTLAIVIRNGLTVTEIIEHAKWHLYSTMVWYRSYFSQFQGGMQSNIKCSTKVLKIYTFLFELTVNLRGLSNQILTKRIETIIFLCLMIFYSRRSFWKAHFVLDQKLENAQLYCKLKQHSLDLYSFSYKKFGIVIKTQLVIKLQFNTVPWQLEARKVVWYAHAQR